MTSVGDRDVAFPSVPVSDPLVELLSDVPAQRTIRLDADPADPADPATPADAGVHDLLAASVDPAVVLDPIRDRDGVIGAFTCVFANEAAGVAVGLAVAELIGRAVRDVIGGVDADALFASYCSVADTGVPLVADAIGYRGRSGELARADVRAVRFGGAVVCTWRDVTGRERAAHERAEAQRIARVGNWRWDPVSDRFECSPETHRLLGLDPAARELTFGQVIAAVAHPDDAAQIRAVRDRAVAEGRSFAIEQRLMRPNGTLRYVVITGEPVGDDGMGPAGLRGTMQDVTERRRSQQRLLDAHRHLLERQFAFERDHTVAETLQAAIMPGTVPDVEGVALAARYRPADRTSRIGGDWYDVVPLPGTRTVALVVGDVEGHDVVAASLMGQLRSAVRTAVLAGRGPATALGDADRFLASLGEERMATVIVAVVDPVGGWLRVATAGHPPVLVVRRNGARVPDVPAEPGPPLGVLPNLARVSERVMLRDGDLIALYTDGLVEARERAIDEGIEALRRQLTLLTTASVEQIADSLLETAHRAATDDLALLVGRFTRTGLAFGRGLATPGPAGR